MKIPIISNQTGYIKGKYTTILSWILFVFIAIILFLTIFFLWNKGKTNDFNIISEGVISKAAYYANEVELKQHRIEFALTEVNDSGVPIFDDSSNKWDTQASFYLQNFEGIESIVWVDKNLIIKKIVTNNPGKVTINQNISSFSPDINHMFVWIPTYQDGEIFGFLFSDINITNLVLSVTKETKDDYYVKLSSYDKEIYASENWSLVDNAYLNSSSFNLESTHGYRLALKPTAPTIQSSIRYTNQILYYGILLSLGVLLVIWLALRSKHKSRLLLISQNELKEKNASLLYHLRNQQKLEAIGLLASGVAHEINNPINGVLNYSQLIIDSTETNSENIVYAQEIIIETERMSKLVNNLLNFSRHKKEYFSKARAEDIINKTANLIRTIYKTNQITLVLNIEENLPSLNCRSEEIQQVLMNLLTNARDALNEKYVEYHENKKVILSAVQINKDNKNWLKIIVEDRGNGIPLSIQSKIFDNFFTTKAVDKGTGLGLPISHGIAQDHGGVLSYETIEGEYTRFILELPLNGDIEV